MMVTFMVVALQETTRNGVQWIMVDALAGARADRRSGYQALTKS
jgi:hypothetical protein